LASSQGESDTVHVTRQSIFFTKISETFIHHSVPFNKPANQDFSFNIQGLREKFQPGCGVILKSNSPSQSAFNGSEIEIANTR